MSIASEITRLQGVKSDILTAIADKGVTVPAGSALDDCPGLIADIGKIENITIAGTTYPVVKIDGKYWMAKNLAYVTSAYTYPNNDSSTVDDCGLLYPFKIVQSEIYPIIPAGWRLPRKQDFTELFTNHTNPLDYLSESRGGNNSLGFSENLAGNRGATSSTAGNYGIKGIYWADNYSDLDQASPYWVHFSLGVIQSGSLDTSATASIDSVGGGSPARCAVRLVCDANPYISYADIGGKRYKTVVMPDGKEWLAENLDYKFCDIGGGGTPTTAHAWYYNNNESTYGWNGYKCGLLYNWYAANFLNDHRSELCPGWHVPTKDEWIAMLNSVGTDVGLKLKSGPTSWSSSWEGNDEYNFNVIPTGYYYNSFNDIATVAGYWVSDSLSSTESNAINFTATNDEYSLGSGAKSIGEPLRLVRDT